MLLQKSIAKELLPACVVLQMVGMSSNHAPWFVCKCGDGCVWTCVWLLWTICNDLYLPGTVLCTSLNVCELFCFDISLFLLHGFEKCMMYDTIFSGTDKAIPQRWSSQQPTSHVTTPWCHNRCGLDSVHGLDLGTSPFLAASWLVDSLLQVVEVVDICWGKWFYVQNHPYVYYISDLL